MPALVPRATIVTQTVYKPGPSSVAVEPTQQGASIPIGAIVGGTLTGVLLTLIVTIGWKWWGWRLMQPVTKKPAHLRIPEKPSRPSSTYSRAGADWKSKAVNVHLRPESPSKSQKCLLLTTPAQSQGRHAPSTKLFAIQEEQGSSTRSSSPYGTKIPRPPSPVAYPKSSLTFPKTGAPQEPRQVKYVTAVASSYDSYGSTGLHEHEHEEHSFSSTGSGKLSRASSVYSMASRESEGQVHHLSYLQHQQQQALPRYWTSR